jgi:hypothetical protein
MSQVEVKPVPSATPERPEAGAAGHKPPARAHHRAASGMIGSKAHRRVFYAALVGPMVTCAWLALFTVGLTVPSKPFRDSLSAIGAPAAAAAPASAADAAGAGAPEGSGATGAVTDGAPAADAAAPAPRIEPPRGFFAFLGTALAAGLTYTPTNLAVLCCVAALIGCCGRVATASGAEYRTVSAAHTSMIVHAHPAPERAEPGKSTPDVKVTVGAEAASGSAQTPGPPGEEAAVGTLAPAVTAVMWGFFIYLALVSGLIAMTGDPFQNATPDQYLRLAGAASLFAFVVGWRPQVLTQLVTQVGPGRLTTKV